MDMVERVARALCKRSSTDPDKMVPGIVVTDLGDMGMAGSFSGPKEPAWKRYEADARAAVDALRMDWQPIETAPKDSTRFIAWDRHEGVIIAKWGDLYLSDGNGRKFGWIPAGRQPGASCSPTHWMPLPDPPPP